MYSCKTGKVEENEIIEEAITEEIPEIIINYEYGLPVDSFDLERGRVGRNQALSLLLSHLGVGNQAIHDIGLKTSGVFDVRKFRTGNNYVAFLSRDTIRHLDYLVYEHSPLNYIVFGFRDSLHVWSANKDVDTIRQTFSGSIESSLWNVITGKGANPVLAIELSEIYAWSIDFFGLQKGDSIRIIYDELYVDSTSIGIGKIYAAYFRHMKNDFYAIPFVQDSTEEFFDDKGKSLKKAFLKAPLRYSRISSKFSNSRLHPILKIRRPHHGVDYAAPLGTPVHSIGDGRVISCSNQGGAGNMVKIRHNSIYSTAYLHLSRYGKGIKTGTYVKQGDIVGYVGSSGLSTGPHLDFRFYKNDVPVDPLRVESPPVDPVREENMERYLLVKDEVILSLQGFN
jgi:murein DD-endopeptidase MepM/ murein hydrolase activator NlpD